MKRQKIFFNKNDPSKSSVSVLNDKARAYLLKKYEIKNSWCPDYLEWYPDLEDSEILDVVFFGDLPRKFLELSLNPNGLYRFWVLSNASKNLLTSLFFIAPERVGVIPRYALYPRAPAIAPVNLQSPINLYYAGHLREEKNILLMLYTVYRLQHDYKLDIEFDLYGDFFLGSDFIDPERTLYQEQVLALLETLNWIKRPVLHGWQSRDSWLPAWQEKKNKACLCFSHYLFEDFNTSVAEAEAAGISTWVGQWGGLLDLNAETNLKIPFDYIGPDNDTVLEAQFKSIGLADALAEKLKKPVNIPSFFQTESIPQPTTKEEIFAAQKLSMKKWGSSLYFILRNDLNLLQDSQRGMAFLKSYWKAFSCERSLPTILVVVNPNDEDLLLKLQKLDWLNLYRANHIKFIAYKYFYKKAFVEDFLGAKKIYLSAEVKKETSSHFLSFIQLLKDASVEVHYV